MLKGNKTIKLMKWNKMSPNQVTLGTWKQKLQLIQSSNLSFCDILKVNFYFSKYIYYFIAPFLLIWWLIIA